MFQVLQETSVAGAEGARERRRVRSEQQGLENIGL